MMKKFIVFLLLFRITIVFACDLPDHFDFEVINEKIVLYYGCYDAVNQGPHIVEYILTKERAEATGINRPSASFSQNRDGGVLQNKLRASGFSLPRHTDYTNSGYDRGHMAPNADFNDTHTNALSTFFIANVWPQTPEVNRVTWLRTENETRRLASQYQAVKVVIIVDEFTEKKVQDIQVPLVFKRRVYDVTSGDLLYEIDIYQEERPVSPEISTEEIVIEILIESSETTMDENSTEILEESSEAFTGENSTEILMKKPETTTEKIIQKFKLKAPKLLRKIMSPKF